MPCSFRVGKLHVWWKKTGDKSMIYFLSPLESKLSTLAILKYEVGCIFAARTVLCIIKGLAASVACALRLPAATLPQDQLINSISKHKAPSLENDLLLAPLTHHVCPSKFILP